MLNGKFHGRLISTESKFGLLRQQQLRASGDPATRLVIARELVRGKLLNQRTLLMRYQRRDGLEQLEGIVEQMKQAIESIESSRDLGGLLGLEGHASALYYRGFKGILKHDLGFAARVRRPPTDPVNSLLSFGYTLLAYNVQAAVNTVGLDPFIGFLHATEYSRPSLVLDLMEEFRSTIVDSVVLWLVNSPVMTDKDFRHGETGERPVLLTDEAVKKFLHYYEERVQSKVSYPSVGQIAYRRCFELQARQLARVIMGKEPKYKPLLVR
ncbi:MAG: CRISPR-associated endonuclease Cas1 [Dethiobacter sp.]